MNISEIIFEDLKRNGISAVPGFGVFRLENAKALLDAAHNTLLPPAKQVTFSPDYQVADRGFTGLVSQLKNIPDAQAENELNTQTDYWKKKFSAMENFRVEPLGEFKMSGESLVFEGERVSADSPDFYGLELINLSEMKSSGENTITQNKTPAYQTNKTFLWIFIPLIILGLGAAAWYNQEMLFGEKSFVKTPLQSKTQHKTPDSLAIIKAVQDSLKLDSIRQDSIKKAAFVPAKKGNGTKKYSKNNQ